MMSTSRVRKMQQSVSETQTFPQLMAEWEVFPAPEWDKTPV